MRLRLTVGTVLLALSSHPAPAQSGVLAGSVNRDSALTQALSGADISIPALQLATRSNIGGDYRFAGIPSGRYLVVVSHAGYKTIADSVTVGASGETFWDFVLATRVTVLDSVVTTGKSPIRQYTAVRLREFEERRREGFGYYIAEDELRKNDHEKVSDILAAHIPGAHVVRTGAGRAYLASLRVGGASLSKPMSSDPVDNLCYPDVYLDGARLATQPDPYRKPPQTPLIATDINQLAVSELAGVEFHPGSATTPARYNAMGQGCGQLMLWTREK
jgi:hypothetical protein